MLRISCILLCVTFCFSRLTGQTIYASAKMDASVIVKTRGGDNLSESHITVYFLNGKLKVITKSQTAESISLVDEKNKKYTQLTEILGKKLGYSIALDGTDKADDSVEFVYVDSTKTINGFRTKKCEITPNGNSGIGKITVWYNPDLKFKDSSSLGINLPGIKKLKGYPIVVETTTKGVRLNYFVTSIDVNPQIDQGEFEIPKGYEIYTLEEYKKQVAKIASGK
jgi:hypothetical protein